MFLFFDERMPNLAKYIIIYGNNESVEVDDLTARRAYESAKSWLADSDKKIHGVYTKKRVLLIDEAGEYV